MPTAGNGHVHSDGGALSMSGRGPWWGLRVVRALVGGSRVAVPEDAVLAV